MLIPILVIKGIGTVDQTIRQDIMPMEENWPGENLDLINDRWMTVLNHSTNVYIKCRGLWTTEVKKMEN